MNHSYKSQRQLKKEILDIFSGKEETKKSVKKKKYFWDWNARKIYTLYEDEYTFHPLMSSLKITSFEIRHGLVNERIYISTPYVYQIAMRIVNYINSPKREPYYKLGIYEGTKINVAMCILDNNHYVEIFYKRVINHPKITHCPISEFRFNLSKGLIYIDSQYVAEGADQFKVFEDFFDLLEIVYSCHNI